MAEPVTTDAIKTVSVEPKQATGDQGSITNHDIGELIKADKYLRSVTAGKKANRRSMFKSMFQRLTPPGARG